MAHGLNFEDVVARHYESLYRFAFSLTRAEAESADLTQQTFYVWATKGKSLRDQTKVKSWLFTTLHRQFLETRRKQNRFPHHEIQAVDHELPSVSPRATNASDANQVLLALTQLDETYQAPVVLFYLEDYAYKEIAGILDLPMGTVKSRISRGIRQLQEQLGHPRAQVKPRQKETP